MMKNLMKNQKELEEICQKNLMINIRLMCLTLTLEHGLDKLQKEAIL